MSFQEVQQRIKIHEGCQSHPYEDSLGVLTIGYGRNLRDVGLSDDEANYLFRNDFKRAKRGAESFLIYESLDRARKGVLIEMCYQLGWQGVSQFRKFLAAARKSDWDTAADEMLDSKWARQTPNRAKTLADIFRNGDVG